jgi:hypothetical protein
MKTKFFSLKPLLVAAGLLTTALPSTGFCGGWFLPTQMPAGEYHKYWAIGLSVPALEQNTAVTTKDDGTHVFVFDTASGQGHGRIYIWDRISGNYNSPAVASTDPAFREYTTLDLNNLTFLKDVYGQLHEMWSAHPTAQQTALLSKLHTAIAKDGDRMF